MSHSRRLNPARNSKAGCILLWHKSNSISRILLVFFPSKLIKKVCRAPKTRSHSAFSHNPRPNTSTSKQRLRQHQLRDTSTNPNAQHHESAAPLPDRNAKSKYTHHGEPPWNGPEIQPHKPHCRQQSSCKRTLATLSLPIRS